MCFMFFGLEQEVEKGRKGATEPNQMQDRWKQKKTTRNVLLFVFLPTNYFLSFSIKKSEPS